MTARSPRLRALVRSSRIAVLFPAPVVPMIGNGNRLPGAGIVRGADQNNIDLWITKAFKVAERHTFELRSEFFQRSEPCAIFDSGNGVRRGEFWRHRVDFGDCPVDSVRIEV